MNIEIVGLIGGSTEAAESAEVELDCDYKLDYYFVIKAITAVSGHFDPETKKTIKLVERIKFSPPKKRPGA